MISFKDMFTKLEETKLNNMKKGTYIALKLSKSSEKKLSKWVSQYNIPNPLDSAEYHTTVIYSRANVSKEATKDIAFPYTAKIKGWTIFPTQNQNRALVAELEAPGIAALHKHIRDKYGATHDYPDYKPHITISYNYPGVDVIQDLPDFEITFDNYVIEELDPEKYT